MSISPENEKLLSDVFSTGLFESEEEALSRALQLLKESTNGKNGQGGDVLARDEWLKEFDQITATRTGGNPEMDDSRDSIYGARG